MGESDKYFVYGWRLSGSASPGSASPTQCYLDNTVYNSWIYEFKYHGFYEWESGKCYYSIEKEMYDCNTKTFSTCNAGYYKNNSTPESSGFTNSCQPCSPGSYTTATNTVPDTGGPDASYNYATSCTLCATGTYNDKSASTSCTACTNKPANSHYVGTGASSANCPWECDAGYNKTLNNTCAPVCDAGIATLHVGSVSIPLYKSRNTTPSLNIMYNGQVCYGDLVNGNAAGELNINYDGKTYHTAK